MAAFTLDLRPLSAGELLDRAVRLYRRHFLTFVGIVAIVQIPLTLLQTGVSLFATQQAADPTGASPAMLIGSLGSLLLTTLGFVLVSSLGTAALTRAVANSYLGQPVSLGGAYRQVGRSWLVLVLALLWIIVLSVLIGLWWLLVPCVGWFTGLGMLIFLSLVITPLTAPAVVLEKKRARAAVRRAWDLSRRRFWPVVGFALALLLLSIIFTALPSLLVGAVLGVSALLPAEEFGSQPSVVATIVNSLTTLATTLIYLPFQLTAMTLLYFDLRVRTEGFDLALLARSVEEEPLATVDLVPTEAMDAAGRPAMADEGTTGEVAPIEEAPPVADLAETIAEAPAPARQRLITGEELGYFLVLTLAVGILYAALLGVAGLVLQLAWGRL